MTLNSILEAIGRTPLVKLHRVSSGLKCNLYAKCEFLNPGGSIKDRIGFSMVEAAEKEGRIKPGDTLIEPTSGNTGIGIALAGAVKGYRVIITLPEKMSREKQVTLEALGAEIIRTPTEAAFDSPDSHISVAKRLCAELPNAHILDQYSNPNNPQIHYDTTAQEILDDLDNKVDMAVIAAGTGGSITGIARKLKEVNPKCIIVGADPEGSILGGGTEIHSYKVEGIGYDFIPDVLDLSLIDQWIKTNDQTSFLLARRIIKEEGLLAGGSSGSALFAALHAAQKLAAGQNCVVILPDGIRNYMTKFVDNNWMKENGFYETKSLNGTVKDLLDKTGKNIPEPVVIDHLRNIKETTKIMHDNDISQVPVTSGGILVGIVSEQGLLEFMSGGVNCSKTQIAKCMNRQVPNVSLNTPLSTLQDILYSSNAAVVVDEKRKPLKVMTRIDLLNYLCGC